MCLVDSSMALSKYWKMALIGCYSCKGHNTSISTTSAVVEDGFLCRHFGSNFIPTATIVDKTWSGNKCSDVPTKI